MPEFIVTSPEGQKFRITAPEGASQEDALAYAQKQFGGGDTAAPPATDPGAPSGAQRISDAIKQAPEAAANFVQAIPRGVVKGLGGVAEMVGTMASGAGKAAGVTQHPAEQIVQSAQAPILEQLPEAKGTAGAIGEQIGEFLPAAAAGPGGVVRRVVGQAVAPAIASEVAGQMTKGTEAEPYARTGAAVVAGLPFGRWRTGQTQSAAPLADELYDAGRQQYQHIRNMGLELRPGPIANMADGIETRLTARGFSRDNVPETFGVIRTLQNLRQSPAGAVVTADNFDTARQQLLQATRNATNRREAAAGWAAIGELDNYLRSIPQAHVLRGDARLASQLFDEARGNWAAAKRVEMVAGKLELGELNAATAHSGTNIDNSLRQAIKQLIRPNKYGESLAERHGFTEQEIAAMGAVARGTATANTLRYIGNLLGGGGGFGQLAVTGAGAAAGYHTGHPELMGVGLAGIGARRAASSITERNAQRLQEMVARRSPAARAAAPNVVPSEAELLTRSALLRAGESMTDDEFRKMLDRRFGKAPKSAPEADASGYGGPQ